MGALEITDCRVRLYNRPDDKLKAFATITFNDCFVVTDLKVIQGNTGQFVAMPSRKRRDGKFRDVAHPLNSETRDMIEKCVLQILFVGSHSFSPFLIARFSCVLPLCGRPLTYVKQLCRASARDSSPKIRRLTTPLQGLA